MCRINLLILIALLYNCSKSSINGSKDQNSTLTDTFYIQKLNTTLLFNNQGIFDTSYYFRFSGMCALENIQGYRFSNKLYFNKAFTYGYESFRKTDSCLHLTITVQENTYDEKINNDYLNDRIDGFKLARKATGNKPLQNEQFELSALNSIPVLTITMQDTFGNAQLLHKIVTAFVGKNKIEASFQFMGKNSTGKLEKFNRLLQSVQIKKCDS